MPQHVFALVAGDFDKGPVDVNNQPQGIGDQHSFAGAIEHGGGLAQALAVFLQWLLDQVRPGKVRAEQVDRQGTEADPQVTAYLKPAAQLHGFIDKVDQYLMAELNPHNRNQQVHQPGTQGTSV